MEIMAWIYPGAPTCAAQQEYSDGRKIDILKPEYFTLNETGTLVLLTEADAGCNGYSAKNVASLKKYSKEQYVTISSSYAEQMSLFLADTGKRIEATNTLVAFVTANHLTGIEIDFEDFGGWDRTTYKNYKAFVATLGDALHKKGGKLMVDGPATADAIEEAWYVWRYADFNALPVDRIVVMTYDYQFDQGAGQPVSPLTWIQDTIKWTKGRTANPAKLSFGIPSYGYRGTIGTQRFVLMTYDQLKKQPGFSTAHRDYASSELTWQHEGTVYFAQDSVSLTKKQQAIAAAGISSVSVWHLGGNVWFER
jgi:spore germination protein YaaH